MTAPEEFDDEDAKVGYWNRMGVFHEGWPPDGMDASTYTPSSALAAAIHDKAFAEAEKEFPNTGEVLGG